MDSDDGEICKCNHCADDGLTTEACSFCYNCKKYFCFSCNKHNSRFFRNHDIIEGKELPRPYKTRSIIHCDEHSREKIEFYCPEHENVLCKLCQIFSHTVCDVITTDFASGNGAVEEDCNEIFENLVELGNSAKSLKEKLRLKQNASSRRIENLRNDIKELRESINYLLNDYEKQLELSEIKHKGIIGWVNDACEFFTDQIGSQLKLVNESKRNLDRERLFIRSVQTKRLCKNLHPFVKNVEIRIHELELGIIDPFDKRLADIVRLLCNLGNTEAEETDGSIAEGISFTRMLKPDLMTFTREYDVRMPGDEELPLITGCCFLVDGLILMCDNSNKKIKAFKTNAETMFEAQISDGPFDVARIDKNQAIISVPNAKCVQLVSVNPDIEIKKTIDIGNKCYGVILHNEIMVVCIADPDTNMMGLQVLSLKEERVIKFIRHNEEGHPGYVAVSHDGCALYYGGGLGATAFIKCTIIEDSTCNESCFSYRDEELKDPKSIIVDRDGNALICEKEGNSVLVLSVNGGKKHEKNVLCKDDKIYQPTSICMSRKEDILVVASHDTEKRKQSYLSFFRLKPL